MTLDSAYEAGQVINADLGPILINKIGSDTTRVMYITNDAPTQGMYFKQQQD